MAAGEVRRRSRRIRRNNILGGRVFSGGRDWVIFLINAEIMFFHHLQAGETGGSFVYDGGNKSTEKYIRKENGRVHIHYRRKKMNKRG